MCKDDRTELNIQIVFTVEELDLPRRGHRHIETAGIEVRDVEHADRAVIGQSTLDQLMGQSALDQLMAAKPSLS